MNPVLLAETMLAALPAFGRVLGLLVGAPFFGQRGIPVQVRVGLALLLTALLAPVARLHTADYAAMHFVQQAALCAGELIIGLAIGYVARLVFAAIQLAGQVIEVPMGLALSGVYDPAQGGQVPVLGQFYYVLVAQMFFLTNGHLGLLRALGDSFQLVPAGQAILGEAAGDTVFVAFAWMFAIGLQIAFPVVVAVLLTDVALGVAVRVVPHFNIFMVGFGLKIIAGMLAAALGIVALISLAAGIFGGNGQFYQQITGFIQGLQIIAGAGPGQ